MDIRLPEVFPQLTTDLSSLSIFYFCVLSFWIVFILFIYFPFFPMVSNLLLIPFSVYFISGILYICIYMCTYIYIYIHIFYLVFQSGLFYIFHIFT